MKLFRKIVDERQELEMMRVERASFWVMFLTLAVVVSVQLFVLGLKLEHIAGEFIVLVAGGAWSTVGYIRRGSWDYFTRPGMKPYLIYSLAAGFGFGIVSPLTWYFRHGARPLVCLLFFIANFTGIFVLVFLTLLLIGAVTKRRQKKLQEEYRDEE